MLDKYYGELSPKLYLCRVPIIATYNEEEAMIYGLPMDKQNNSYNKETYLEMTNCMININKMINLYMDGYPISVINPQDSKEIFDYLDKYLNTHVNNIQRSINQPLKNDERLMEIDKFLNEMFSFNKQTIVKDMLQQNSGYDLGLGLVPTMHSQEVKEQAANQQHTSITDAYNNNNNASGGHFIQQNQIGIRMDDIKRDSVMKPKKVSINASYLNK